MRHLFFILVCCCSSCATYVYQPEIMGVVYDSTTRQPVADADIVFIQDTLTLGATYGSLNFNAGKRYTTDENGSFQTEVWKDRFMNNHHFRSDLSWVFVVEKLGYIPDTINLRDMGTLNKPKHLLDTIWLRQMPDLSVTSH